MEPRSRPGVWQAATPRLAHDLRLPFLEAHFPPTIHHDGGLSRREAVHRRRSALPPSCSCYAYPRSHPSETAPLLQDVDHPDADSRPQHSSFTSIIQEPLTSLTKVLLVVALLFLLLSSIFIGLFAGAQHKLNTGRGQEPPVTVTSTVYNTATSTQTQTQTQTQTATSTTVSTSTVSVPGPIPTGPHEEVSGCLCFMLSWN